MKHLSVFALVLTALLFSSCSREEPALIVTAPPPLGALVMNEIFARGAAPDLDWIEIYNPNSSSVDLTNYKIYDSGGQGGTKPKKVFPAGVTIPAKGFYVIVTDVADSSGFGLSSAGEDVWFENASGVVIDQIKFLTTTTASQSFGRVPDGSANWTVNSAITKGAPNQP
ncbi:MAG: lamin tail domain-containing protein [Ignavibacteriales bacterium]|nr:lamin tail domain-containing protein [Ignavibacteriales bacterium]